MQRYATRWDSRKRSVFLMSRCLSRTHTTIPKHIVQQSKDTLCVITTIHGDANTDHDDSAVDRNDQEEDKISLMTYRSTEIRNQLKWLTHAKKSLANMASSSVNIINQRLSEKLMFWCIKKQCWSNTEAGGINDGATSNYTMNNVATSERLAQWHPYRRKDR